MRKEKLGSHVPTLIVVALLVQVLPLVGCGGRADIFEEPIEAADPVALSGGVAYVSKTFERVVLVSSDPGDGRPCTDTFRVGRNPIAWRASHDKRQFFVICHGAVEGEARPEQVQQETLWVLDSVSRTIRTYTLDNPFTWLVQSPSGRWAVAYFRDLVEGTNPNLIAVIDLTREPSTEVATPNPYIHDVTNLGSRPMGVVFMEGVHVRTRGRDSRVVKKNLALVLSRSYVSFLDLDYPDRKAISVRLTTPTDLRDVIPVEEDVIVIDDPSGERSRILLRSDSASDIFSITLGGARNPESSSDYSISAINQLSVAVGPSGAPTDMALFEDGGRKLVLAVSKGAGIISILDPETTNVTDIWAPLPVEEILLFNGGREALLYASGETLGYFLSLENLTEELERNLDEFSFGGPLSVLMTVPGRDLTVFTRADGDQNLYFLDLLEKGMDAIAIGDAAQEAHFLLYPDGSRMLVSSGGTRFWLVEDMQTFTTETIIVDEPIIRMWGLDKLGWIVLDHGYAEGYLTFLDADDPKRSKASSLWGFLLEDVISIDPDDYPLSGE